MWPCRDKNNPQPSDRLQILDQIRFLLLAQGCLKVIVVVIDYVGERHKSSIVVKAALVDFLRIPKSSQFAVTYRSSGARLAWKSSIPISSALCKFQPGSVNSGGTWHVAQRALPLKSASPRPAAATSNAPEGGFGTGSDS